MTDEMIQTNSSGLILSRGAIQKVFDPEELKYAAAAHAPAASQADLTKYVGIVDDAHDSRPPVDYQEDIGACSGWQSTECNFAAFYESNFRAGNRNFDIHRLHPGAIYEDARKKRGWFPSDSGSVPSDCFDLMLEDAPLFSSHGYVSDPAFQYPRSVWDDGKQINYLGSHRPIYVTRGFAIEEMWIALSQGQPLAIATYWSNRWMSLNRGVIPEGVTVNPNEGGHAIMAYAYVPGLGFLCQNSWSSQWSPDAPQTHRYLRPGDFVFPLSYFIGNSPVFDVRAISSERVKVEPNPQPDPLPKPQPPAPDPSPEPRPQPPSGTLNYAAKMKINDAGYAVYVPDDMSAAAKAEREKFKKRHGVVTFTTD